MDELNASDERTKAKDRKTATNDWKKKLEK